MNYITSRSNEKIKLLVKLQDSKYRKAEQMFLLEGVKLAQEYLTKVGVPEEVFVKEDALEQDWLKKLINCIPEEKITCVTDEVYDKISSEKSPQGILFVCRYLDNISFATDDDTASGAVLLESIRDAGNLGTIIRTACAMGVNHIFVSSDCADLYNTKTQRAAMGAIFGAKIVVCEDLLLIVTATKRSGGKVFAAMPSGDALMLQQVNFEPLDAVVIGNEGEGISKSLAAVCEAVKIPMAQGAESLNASAAAAIILWEWQRTKF